MGNEKSDANPFSHRSLSELKGSYKEGKREELNPYNTRLLSVSASRKGQAGDR